MRVAALLLLFAAACDQSGAQADQHAQTQAQSRCETRYFEASRFTVCSSPKARIEIHSASAAGQPYRSFAALEAALGNRAGDVLFGMNGGMFDEAGHAIGLLIEDGERLHPISRRGGGGNFGMLPNGVFLVRDSGKAEVVETSDFEAGDDIAYATQSGPMLVIDGKLHPKFDRDGDSRHIRNGVGIAPDGAAVFVISEDVVSFGKFGRFFRDQLKTENALYFDGSVSSLWDPRNGRRDALAELGPMVVAFKAAESAPGREGRATP